MLLSVNVGRKGKLRDSLFHPPIPLPPPPQRSVLHPRVSLVNIDKETKRGDCGRVVSQPTPSPLYLPTKRLPVFN